VDRLEALVYAAQHDSDAISKEIVILGLNDKYKGIRSIAIDVISPAMIDASLVAKIEDMASNDADRPNRADAIKLLGEFRNEKYEPLFVKGLTDSSYSIAGASLAALGKINDSLAVIYLPQLRKDARGLLKQAIQQLDILTKTEADFDEVYNGYDKADLQDKFPATFRFIPYLVKVNNPANFKKGVDAVIAMRDKYGDLSKEFKDAINEGLKDVATKKAASKDKAANPADVQKDIDYINSVIKN
jgi:aminopeptidase N